jgi:2-iminoacetate synthase ThiH
MAISFEEIIFQLVLYDDNENYVVHTWYIKFTTLMRNCEYCAFYLTVGLQVNRAKSIELHNQFNP